MLLLALTFSLLFHGHLDSITADFPERDKLPESKMAVDKWYEKDWNGGWGPIAVRFAPPEIPKDADEVAWKRERIVKVAEKYIGLPYRHHHIPLWNPPASLVAKGNEGPGLDCSNFSSWVYNYGLGMHLNSDINKQAKGEEDQGRQLAPGEEKKPGDILFVRNLKDTKVTHCAIWIGDDKLIDCHGEGVKIRPWTGWYKDHLDHVRRYIGA